MERECSEKIALLIEQPDDGMRRQEVAELLSAEPGLIEELVEQWQIHSELQWSLAPAPAVCGAEQSSQASAASPKLTRRLSQIGSALLATAVLLGIVAVGVAYRSHVAPAGTVISTDEITWAKGTEPLAVGDSFRRGLMEGSAGSCTLRFNSGVQLVCAGAFRLRIIDDMHVELEHGKVRANVPSNALGFSVDTPDTLLVDQGTEFGVSTEVGDGTKVVVFQGKVDVHTKSETPGGGMRQLSRGEAALLQSGRNSLDRVTQVTSGGLPDHWSASETGSALFSVRDNIRAADSLKYYNVVVGGLNEDVPTWVDRVHEWNGITPGGIPKIVRGADYAMTFNDDRYNPAFRMYVTVHQPAILYIFIDNRIAPVPDWLLRDFEDTGEDIGLDEGVYLNYYMKLAQGAGQSIDRTFSIWRRILREPTELELGSINAPPKFGMYGLAAKPLESLDETKVGADNK